MAFMGRGIDFENRHPGTIESLNKPHIPRCGSSS